MAKKRTTQTKKVRDEHTEIIRLYVIALAIIALSLIGLLKVGVVGNIITQMMMMVVGNLYSVGFVVLIIFSIGYMRFKTLRFLEMKQWIGCIILLVSLLIIFAIPSDKTIVGMRVINEYLADMSRIFGGELSPQGGLIGAILYSLTSLLFDRIGTLIVMAVCVILGLLLLSNKAMFDKVKQVIKEHREVSKMKKEERKELKLQEKIAQEEAKQVDFINYNQDDEQEEVEEPDVKEIKEVKSPSKFMDVNDVFDDTEVEEDNPIMHEVTPSIKDMVVSTSAYITDFTNYKLPSARLLQTSKPKGKSNVNSMNANQAGKRLVEILSQFSVPVTLVDTHIGPSVTKFELRPEHGVRVNRISNLQQDIKMGLAAKDIRIEAPIPGKSTVGIEIPNQEKTMVTMKDLIRNVPESEGQEKLLFTLGKDLMGQGVYGKLNKLPHLLIAGSTGSGKSVCVNTIICSILMRAKPNEVKMLLIDPKKVEFTQYTKVPHLLAPVITNAEEASRALKVVVKMMDDRYDMFAKCGVRNIAGFNEYIAQHPEETIQPMPFIMVVIDELADLMLVASKEVEASIQRITQLARAAGIHLIVATQRPSVDVITGIIKANIPSRIAFAVSSAIDSRTILDQHGAEKLLGNGDMLYLPVGTQVATRLQGCFLSDDEVSAVANACSNQALPRFEDVFLRLDQIDGQGGSVSESKDPLYDEVKQFVVETQKASTSFIQRKFSVGYARAARLVDMLEADRVIGPARGSRPREVFIKPEE